MWLLCRRLGNPPSPPRGLPPALRGFAAGEGVDSAHVLRALIGVLAVAVLLAVSSGCGGSETEGPDAAGLLETSIEQTGAVETFHFTLDQQSIPKSTVGLQLTGAEGDAILPDRAQADVTGNFAGTAIATKIVAIGDDVWLENPLAGTWQAVDVSTTPVALLDPAGGVLGVMSEVAEPTDEGTEDMDGVTVHRISGTVAAADVAPLFAVTASDRDVPVMLWIGDDDLLLRRIEVRGPIADGEPDDALRIVEISRFDEPVTIEQPEGTG